MFTQKLHIAFVGLIILSLLIHVSQASPTYGRHACTKSMDGIPLITSYPTYLYNLNRLLSSLSSDANMENGFNKTVVGRDTPNAVIGQYLCRGDVNTTVCQECVVDAYIVALQLYSQEREAVIWCDECLIRYAAGSIFIPNPGIVPSKSLSSHKNVSEADRDRFEELLSGAMDSLAMKAANSDSGKKFSTEENNFTSTQTVYSLAQCTPDLSADDCNTCLRSAIGFFPSCCRGKQGGRNLLPSCFVRYETFPFYNATASQSLRHPGKSSVSTLTIVASVIGPTAVLALLVTGSCLLRHKRARNKNKTTHGETGIEELIYIGSGGSINFGGNEFTTIESLQFDLATIETATKKFSGFYKLGEGGFGQVYKGILCHGQEIAVKRLAKTSGQGAEEFKNEVVLVAKLQHRNLVRLLGFCLEGGEKMLVYEFVPNKSLDYFLFDSEKRRELDWSTRHKIIEGIARGILYLHEDSRLRVIHRDLKPSNVLLDADMNPKVSDFGMARMFGIDQTQGNTRRIVGTYGYMAPEYAMDGLYSIKSDVFSFGVLLLEILNGKRNNSFHLMGYAPSLVAYAWQLWNEGKGMELIDPLVKDSCPPSETLKYVHIGLLCVQEDANKRPTMFAVVLMLKSESLTLPQPERPAFVVGRFTELPEIGIDIYSINTMAVSDFVPR